MSIKIYNAYRVRGSVGMNEVMELLYRLKDKEKEDYAYNVRNVHKFAEDRGKAAGARKPSLDVTASAVFQSQMIKMQEVGAPGSSAVIYFHTKYSSPGIVIQFFGNRSLMQEVNKVPWLTDWHWQNQTDPEDGISDREWRRRENWWKSMMERSGVPAKVGLSFDLLTEKEAHEINWYWAEIRNGCEPDQARSRAIWRAHHRGPWYSLLPKSRRDGWVWSKKV